MLRAHGVKPRWGSAEAQGPVERVKGRVPQIDLRSHDLRHEYASRLVERGVPLAPVRDLLGHASITTTERYDNQKLEILQIAAAKLESGLTCEPPAREPVAGADLGARTPARAKFSRIFQVRGC